MTAQPQEDKLARARESAMCTYANIVEMVEALEAARADDESDNEDTRIQESPLSIQARSGWYSPGADHEAEEYEILLTTGGPAVRIVGDLNGGEPSSARLECQDWFTPWVEVCDGVEQDVLLAYARCFYFGE